MYSWVFLAGMEAIAPPAKLGLQHQIVERPEIIEATEDLRIRVPEHDANATEGRGPCEFGSGDGASTGKRLPSQTSSSLC